MSDPKFEREIIDLSDKGFKYHLRHAAIDRFQLPGGKQGQWESFQRPPETPTVLMAGLTTGKELVLVNVFRTPVSSRTFELPGGQVNPGEDFQVAVRREYLEETGYTTVERFRELASCWYCNWATNEAAVIYYAGSCEKVQEPALDPVEEYMGLTVIEQAPAEIVREIANGNRAYDPTICAALLALHFTGWVKL